MFGKPKDYPTENDRAPSPVQQLQRTPVAASEASESADAISSISSSTTIVGKSKYPPAEPGALGWEPLEAAGPCCINPHSYSHCAMPPQEPSVLLGHPYLTFW